MIRALPFLLALAACGPAASPLSDRAQDLEPALRALNRGVALTTAFATTGVIDPGAGDQNIALAIYNRLMTEAPGCGAPTVAGTKVTLALGEACALQTAGMTAGGTIEAEVRRELPDEVTVRLVIDGVVDGQALAGTFDVATSTGTTFTWDGELTLAGVQVRAPKLTAGVQARAASLTATTLTVTGQQTFTLEAVAVEQRFDACYPHDGTALVSPGAMPERWTFTSTTPQDGLAQALAPNTSTAATVALPKRPGCPRG